LKNRTEAEWLLILHKSLSQASEDECGVVVVLDPAVYEWLHADVRKRIGGPVASRPASKEWWESGGGSGQAYVNASGEMIRDTVRWPRRPRQFLVYDLNQERLEVYWDREQAAERMLETNVFGLWIDWTRQTEANAQAALDRALS